MLRKERLKLLDYITNAIFVIAFVVFLFANRVSIRDMIIFNDMVDRMSLTEFLQHYSSFTSRYILQAMLYIIIKLPFFVFVTLTIILCEVAMYVVKKYLRCNILESIIINLSLALFPNKILIEAGLQNVVINYIWVFCFFIISIIPLLHTIKKVSYGNATKVLIIICTIVASNMEQMAGILTGLFAINILWNLLYKRNKPDSMLIILFLIALISLILHLTNSGNSGRYALSIETYFPTYGSYNFIDKLWLSYYTTLNFLFGDFRLYVLLFLIALLVYTYIHEKRFNLYVILAIIPIVYYMFVSATKVIDKLCKTSLQELHEGMVLDKVSDLINYPTAKVGHIIFFTFLVIIVLILFVRLKLIFTDVTAMLIVGMASKFIIGFSPTVIASGERTGVYLLLIILLCTIRISDNLCEIVVGRGQVPESLLL